MSKDKMLVEAIRDGIVLDHIPSDKLFKIVALLHLEELTTPVTIGNNLQSVRHKRKGIIKMADHFFSPKDVDKIALLAPEVHLNVIRDYQVVEKRKVTLPVEVRGLVRCPNPKCITNAEPMQTFFHVAVIDEGKGILECHYCGRKTKAEEAELL